MRPQTFLLTLAVVLGLSGPVWGAGKELVIVTSFPKDLFDPYKKAYEVKHPGVKVVINAKPTPAAITYVRETRARPDADIFWASSPDAFVTRKGDGLLELYRLPGELAPRIPAKVGAFPTP